MKHPLAAVTCAAALVASLTACSGADNKSGLPGNTGGPTPSATASSRPAATPTSATPTNNNTGPGTLAAHSTYSYDGLNVVVDLPTNITSTARPVTRVFSDFLLAVARTTSRNKLDPSLSGLARKDVVAYVQTFVERGSVKGVGSMVFTVSKVQASASGFSVISGCVDQSKLTQVRKDGSRFVDANTRKYPTLTFTAETNPGPTSPIVSRFTYAPGSC